MKRWYVVTSPEMEYVDYVADLGGGPSAYGVDWCVVWARTRRDATTAAVRHWHRRCPAHGRWSRYGACCWPHTQRRDGANPFTGLKVERVPAEWQEEWDRSEWDEAVR